MKPYIDNFNCKNINFPLKEQDYKIFEMNNKSIALNILQQDTEKISHVYKSKFNKTRKNKAILLIITDCQRKHYVCVKKSKSSLKPLNHCSENYCLNCLKPFRTKSRLEKHYYQEDC